MDTNALLLVAVPILLGGGLLTALVALYRARRTIGPETDSIIVNGAEKAVLTMKQALEAAQHETSVVRADRDRLLVEVADKALRIKNLEERLDRVGVLLEEARRDLADLRAGR